MSGRRLPISRGRAKAALIAAALLAASSAGAHQIGEVDPVAGRPLRVMLGRGYVQEKTGYVLLVPKGPEGEPPACPGGWAPVFQLSASWSSDLGAPDAPGRPPRPWWLCWRETAPAHGATTQPVGQPGPTPPPHRPTPLPQ